MAGLSTGGMALAAGGRRPTVVPAGARRLSASPASRPARLRSVAPRGASINPDPEPLGEARRRQEAAQNVLQGRNAVTLPKGGAGRFGQDLAERIQSGEFSDKGSTKERLSRPMRRLLAKDPIGPGRAVAYFLAKLGQIWRRAASLKMPEATGDIREIVGQPVFVPLYNLFRVYGGVFRLSFGPKSFVVVSDPAVAKQVLMENAGNYSKGMLSEILDFVMGTGLIPADGETWKMRRRTLVPALHKKYVESMLDMFGESTLHGLSRLEQAADYGGTVEMENYFSRLALDIIGKAVFNYDFDSLTNDDPIIRAVYTTLREAEYRSLTFVPYWRVPPLAAMVPRQRACTEALQLINTSLTDLIEKSRKIFEDEGKEFDEDFLSAKDPSILHFLIASGDDISSKQLRDDLMTLLIAGHETTAAVLTWTFFLLSQHPEDAQRVKEEVDRVIGDRKPTLADMKELQFTTRVINESMRLYPQPPVLIRRALKEDNLDGYTCKEGDDMFISVWNLHRSPELWEEPHEFRPMRKEFGPLGPIPNEATTGFKYLPFGGGRRKCIGDQFALFESICALAMLMRRFDFELDVNAPAVGMTTGATIHTVDGLHLKPTRRVLTPEPEPKAEPATGEPAAKTDATADVAA